MLFGDEEAVNTCPYWRGENTGATWRMRGIDLCGDRAATCRYHDCNDLLCFFETNVLCAADSQVHD